MTSMVEYMLSKNKEKYIRGLQRKKLRLQYRQFLLEGEKMSKVAMQYRPELIQSVMALPEWLERYGEKLPNPVEQIVIDQATLRRISSMQNPNQVLMICHIPAMEAPAQISGLALYLDGIQDPGNLGTILRLADWFGVEGVYLSPGCVDPYNPKVVQSSMGGVLTVPFQLVDLSEWKDQNPGACISGAVMDGDAIQLATYRRPELLVIGNEGNGIHPDHLPLLDRKLTIPSAPSTRLQSLNAAMACGILLSHLTRTTQDDE